MPGRGTGTQAEALSWLRDGLGRGDFRDGMPTVRQLAARFKCSITPVHRALRHLQDEGRVRLRHGAGAEMVPGAAVRPSVTVLLDGSTPTRAEPALRAVELAARDWMLHHLARAEAVQVRLQGSGEDETTFCAAAELCLREPPTVVVFTYPQRFTPAMLAAVAQLQAAGIAVVRWAALEELPGCDQVESDFAEGSRLLTAAVVAHGHRRPLRLAYPGRARYELQKQAGFAAVLGSDAQALTLYYPEAATDRTTEEAWLMRTLPEVLKRTRADAILAANDAQVPMFYAVLARLGRSMPVAGYDRTWHELLRSEPQRAASGPEPISVDRDLPELGRRLAALAVARASGCLPRRPQKILVPSRLHLPPGW